MTAILDLSFPGQWTTTVTSCIPHDSVYMPGPRAGKSENNVVNKQRPTKKCQNKDFAKNGRKTFCGYTMMRKRRKSFALFARKQREKNPFASGCINFQHSMLTKHAWTSEMLVFGILFLAFSHVVVCYIIDLIYNAPSQ